MKDVRVQRFSMQPLKALLIAYLGLFQLPLEPLDGGQGFGQVAVSLIHILLQLPQPEVA